MTTLDTFALDDRSYAKACAENFKRYAMSIDIRKRIRDSQRYLRSLGLIPSPPPSVAPPPPPVATEPEPEIDFAPRTNTQKLTRHHRENTLPFQRVRAAICAAGRALTGAEIAAATGYSRKRTSQVTSRMKTVGCLFVVGFTTGANDWTALYHTDPTIKQSSPAAVVLAEKRAARIRPSASAMQAAQAVIAANFRPDSIAPRLYDILALNGPLTASQIRTRLNSHITSVGDCLNKLQRLGLVTCDAAVMIGKGVTPGLWDVVGEVQS